MTQFLFTEHFLLGTGMKEKEVSGLFCSPLPCSTSAQITGMSSRIVAKAHPSPSGFSCSSFAAPTRIVPAPEVREESPSWKNEGRALRASSRAFDPLFFLPALTAQAQPWPGLLLLAELQQGFKGLPKPQSAPRSPKDSK